MISTGDVRIQVLCIGNDSKATKILVQPLINYSKQHNDMICSFVFLREISLRKRKFLCLKGENLLKQSIFPEKLLPAGISMRRINLKLTHSSS